MDKKQYPENSAQVKWSVEDIDFFLVHQEAGHWCGYCRFDRRPVKEQEYDGILTYVPVHGGITYAREGSDGTMTYGFDCAHADDENNPNTWDESWLRTEAERMAIAIKGAVEYEDRYLLASDDKEKAAVIDEYHDKMRESDINFELTNNFGAMINAMFGGL